MNDLQKTRIVFLGADLNPISIRCLFIDEGIDTGDIILQAVHDVRPDDDETSLRARSIEIGAPLLVQAVSRVLAGTVSWVREDGESSHFRMAPRGASRL